MAVPVKGKWAQGIQPRNFAWILKDRLAVCERPGGYGANHRRVRRQEEIIWIREQGFTCVVTLIPSPHNLHNYDELGVPWRHVPFGPHEEPITVLADRVPRAGRHARRAGGKVLVHQDELSDRVAGLMAGYLLWSEVVPAAPAGHLGRGAAAVPADGPARARPRRPRRHRPRSSAWPPATSSSSAGLRLAGVVGVLPARAGAAPAARGRPRPAPRPGARRAERRPRRHRRLRRRVRRGRAGGHDHAATRSSRRWPSTWPTAVLDADDRDRRGHRRRAQAAAAGGPAAEHVRRPDHPGGADDRGPSSGWARTWATGSATSAAVAGLGARSRRRLAGVRDRSRRRAGRAGPVPEPGRRSSTPTLDARASCSSVCRGLEAAAGRVRDGAVGSADARRRRALGGRRHRGRRRPRGAPPPHVGAPLRARPARRSGTRPGHAATGRRPPRARCAGVGAPRRPPDRAEVRARDPRPHHRTGPGRVVAGHRAVARRVGGAAHPRA